MMKRGCVNFEVHPRFVNLVQGIAKKKQVSLFCAQLFVPLR